MFLNSDEMKRRLNRPDNLINKLAVKSDKIPVPKPSELAKHSDEPKTKIHHPTEILDAAAAATHVLPHKEAARIFGVNKFTIQNRASGYIGGREVPDKKRNIKQIADDLLDEVRYKATDKLYKILDLVDENEFANAKMRDQAAMLNAVAGVVSKTNPKSIIINNSNEVDNSSKTAIIQPPKNEESFYETVEIGG